MSDISAVEVAETPDTFSDFDGMDFSLDGDGRPVVSGDEEPETGKPAEEPAPATADTAAHDYEKRYKDLRPEFDRKAQELSETQKSVRKLELELAELRGRDSAKPKDSSAPEAYVLPENFLETLADPEKGAAALNDVVVNSLKTNLGPMFQILEPMIMEYQINAEIRDAAKVEGREDFWEVFPTMAQLISESPVELGFDAAYVQAKNILSRTPKTDPAPSADPPAGDPSPTPGNRVLAAEVQARAARLAPETSVSADVPSKKVSKTPTLEEAFDEAFEEIQG